MILGGGKYLGRTEESIKQLNKSHEEVKNIIATHIESDAENLKDINEKFTEIQVNMATMGRSQARTERQTRRD